MKRLNSHRMKLMLIGFVAVILFCGRCAQADFTFGEPTNLGPMVNSSDYEESLCISADGLSLYFASDRAGGYENYMDDIWLCTRSTRDDPWGPAENLGPIVNSPVGEFHPSISADELELYFERFDYGTGSDIWAFSIWMTKRADKDTAWEQPVKIDLTVPSGYMAACPSISADGLELYYGVARFGDEPQCQLYMTKRDRRDAPWGEPISLGPVVNSWSSQVMPMISSDGLLLFFNDWWADSPRPGGLGLDDIWLTRRETKDGNWSEPISLGAHINTPSVDWCGTTSADGSTLYFSSQRPGGLGGHDIWQAPILPVVDLNNDGTVDAEDMCIIVEHWGTDNSLCDIGPMPWGDGIVDVQDLIVLAEHLFEDYRLVAHWKLDEQVGDIAYDGAGEFDATLYGEPAWQSEGGMVGGALQLDGIDDYVETNFILNPADGSFSVFAWLKGGLPGQVIISQADTTIDTPVGSSTNPGSTWLGANPSDGRLVTGLMDISFGQLKSESVITDGQWHHVGLVFDIISMKRRLYVDGTEVAVDFGYVGGVSSDAGLYIGAGQALDVASFFSGLLDDVRIYNAALRAEEIAALAQ